jgi:hypothetical protein
MMTARAVDRLLARDRSGGQAQHVEHPGQIDVDGRLEAVQVQRCAVFADQPAATGRATMGVHRDAQRAK